jgi:hypothetical protein
MGMRRAASACYLDCVVQHGGADEPAPPFMNGGAYTMTLPPKQEDSRYAAVRQYSLAQILAVWAAAAIPMAVLAWVVAPPGSGLYSGA